MGRPKTVRSEIVQQYIAKFPKASTRELSRLIYDENPEAFDNLEQARDRVRLYRGGKGAAMREKIKVEQHFNEFNMKVPKSDCKNYTNYVIPNSYKKGIVLSDIHLPYHDKVACEVALEYAYKEGVEFIFLNGDLLDFHELSHYCKDPRMRSFPEEADMGKEFLRDLKKNFPEAKIIYKVANHEDRYEKYIFSHAPSIWGVDALKLHELLELEDMGIEYIESKRRVKYHKLFILHGHEYGQAISATVNPARGIFNKALTNTLIGHCHRSSEHTDQSVSGKIITCWSSGCLCGLNPDYRPLNKWNHGFVILKNDTDLFFAENKRIINGKLV